MFVPHADRKSEHTPKLIIKKIVVCGGTSELHAPQKAGPKLTGRYICAPPHKGNLYTSDNSTQVNSS